MIGWIVVVLIVAANGIARIYTGAHWPTDVLGAIFIAVAWLTFLLSLRWISTRVSAQTGVDCGRRGREDGRIEVAEHDQGDEHRAVPARQPNRAAHECE